MEEALRGAENAFNRNAVKRLKSESAANGCGRRRRRRRRF
jgi:hypothetical protein